MSDALKLWPIAVQNPVTKEWLRFIGQGSTVAEAVKDGIDNVTNIGANAAVALPDGRKVNRPLKQFESDTPYQEGAA